MLMITGLVSCVISTFVWLQKCGQAIEANLAINFRKGVDPEWGSYTPLHLKSNPVPNPLLLKEWSVANPLHSLHWIGLWSGVSRSEPVSDKLRHFCSEITIDRNILSLSSNRMGAIKNGTSQV